MKNLFFKSVIIIFCFIGIESYTQSLPVGMPVLEDYYRRAQLLGKFDSSISFVIRPIFPLSFIGNSIFDPDSTLIKERILSFDGRLKFGKKDRGLVQLLPISWLNQFNSHHPEGINDGSMIPSRGYQTKISAGVYVKYGPLSIQLRPEFVYAQNKSFDGFPQNYISEIGIEFPNSPYYRNNIDLPERFGDGVYNKAFWGQSSIRLTFGSVSFGLSNENLWWGPGYRNSLLMTNSAPGFMHLTLNTVKPIKTFIGSFEGQIIAGRLEESGYAENFPDDWRYINAMVLSYNPKWVPGLFLGVIRSFEIYRGDMGTSFGDYLPVFIPLSKGASGTNEEVNLKRRNQLISVFMRWLFKESHGEIYFEYGRGDHSWDMRDFILEPSHSSAFVLGLRKLFSLNKQKETYLQLILEICNLTSNQTTINRFQGTAFGSWYQHSSVKHGYTHQGQLLGAGIGPGSNMQTLNISWVKSIKQIGIQFERYVHNNDFWYNYIKDFRSNWVDISTTAFANWDYKNLLFTIKLKYIKSRNYQWLYEPPIHEPPYDENPSYWMPSDNTLNFHGQLGVMYRF